MTSIKNSQKIFNYLVKYVFLFIILFQSEILHSQNKKKVENSLKLNKKDYWIGEFNGNFATFSKNGYYGIIDNKEQIIVPMEYDEILITDSLFYANKHQLNFIFDLKGKLIDKPKNDLVLRRSGRIFLHDTQSDTYFDNFNSKEGVFVSGKKLYDVNGFLISEINYDKVYSFNEGVAIVIKFTDGLGTKHTCGYINKNGKEIYPVNCKSCGLFNNGRAIIFKEGKHSIIDNTGKIIITYPEDVILGNMFENGLCYYRQGGKCGYINTDGKIVIQPIYDSASNFKNGFAKVKKDGIEIFIDPQNKEYFNHQNSYFDGHRFMNYNGRKVYENKNQEIIFDYTYDKDIGSLYYQEGLLIVKKENKEGAIDRLGNVIIPVIYDFIKVQNGYVFARENDDVWLLNKQGEKLLKVSDGQERRGKMIKGSTLGNIYFNPLGFLKTPIDDKYGVVDSYGKLILPYEYDDVFFENNCITAKKGNNVEVYDYSGKNKLLLGEQKFVSGHENGYITKDNSNLYVYNTEFKQKFNIKNIDAEYPQRGAKYSHLLYPYKDVISNKYGFIDLINFKVIEPNYDGIFALLSCNRLVLNLDSKNILYNPLANSQKVIDFHIAQEINSSIIKVTQVEVSEFYNGISSPVEYPSHKATNKRYYGLIDCNGNLVQEVKYSLIDYISLLKNKNNVPENALLFGEISNGEIVFFDKNGKIVN